MRSLLRLGLALVVLCLGAAGPAHALLARAGSAPDRLASLLISIWPEYDRPEVLFVYRGELAAGTALPARITFRLPVEPTFAAGIDEKGGVHGLRPAIARDGPGVLVTCETNWPRFQLEYYQDALEKGGPARCLVFVYEADYAIAELTLEVKEPFGATDLALAPPATVQSQAEGGLTEHRRIVGPVARGDEVRWEISYTKRDPRLVSEAMDLPTPAPVRYDEAPASPVPWGEAGERATRALLGLGGVALAGALGLWLRGRQASRAGASAPAEGKAPASRAGARGVSREGRLARYCHWCGASFYRDALYCRKCGTPRRGAQQPRRSRGGRR
ncbi:MAG: hypothetical protein K6V36_16050 [Anaerolineae bacterium]|nr:hypothetical protein [Anaerolineae bacterium]